MSRFRSDLLRTLDERGFLHQISEPERLDALAAEGMITAYIGFDATAPSLHVGHMVQIMLLFWAQKTGHRPIALMGGGTTKVGDPSFRNEARPLLTEEAIAANLVGIRQVFDRFLTFGEGGNAAVMLDNSEWLDGLNYLEFLRDVGRHFSVNRMLSFDSVKARLEKDEPLSFLEFNYMILQAYDFVELHRRYGCRVQMGGSDQWGNIVNGIDLGRRLDQADLFAVTSPLLTTSSGAKMGKTASGAVWLDSGLRPVFDFWQYWRNVEDADVGRFLKMFTELPLDEVARLERLGGQEINDAKKVLATEVTALVHGRGPAEEAAEAARQTFEQGALAANLPTIEIARSEFEAGLGVLAAFVKAELVSSTSDARRQIKAGGLKVNDQTVTDERAVLAQDDLSAEDTIKLSLGRKRHVLIRPS